MQNYDPEDGDGREAMMPVQVPNNTQTALWQGCKGQGKGGNTDLTQDPVDEPGSAQEGLELNNGYVGKGQSKGKGKKGPRQCGRGSNTMTKVH